MNVVLVFSSFSPYHHARALALRTACHEQGHHLITAAMTAPSLSHQWTPISDLDIHILCHRGSDGDVSLKELLLAWIRFLRTHRPAVVIIAGYWPFAIALLSLVAVLKRIPRILMTESHSGTAKRTGLGASVKSLIIRSFSGALVGGRPHKEYLVSLGFNATRVLDGYDCVDNSFFENEAASARANPEALRKRLCLPEIFFLSVGRLVPKKNIGALVVAYAQYCARISLKPLDLVIVGDGELGEELRNKCVAMGCSVRDVSREAFPSGTSAPRAVRSTGKPTVHFYGSRKVTELPAFFAHARAFILPSVQEEWGLVVNEAMSSGCPVIVSDRAGCALDLLPEAPAGENLNCCCTSQIKVRSSGILFDPERPEGLSEALELITVSPELAERMGANAQSVIRKYNPRRFAEHALLLAKLAKE